MSDCRYDTSIDFPDQAHWGLFVVCNVPFTIPPAASYSHDAGKHIFSGITPQSASLTIWQSPSFTDPTYIWHPIWHNDWVRVWHTEGRTDRKPIALSIGLLCWQSIIKCSRTDIQGTLGYKNFQDFPGPRSTFQDPVICQRCLYMTQTAVTMGSGAEPQPPMIFSYIQIKS